MHVLFNTNQHSFKETGYGSTPSINSNIHGLDVYLLDGGILLAQMEGKTKMAGGQSAVFVDAKYLYKKAFELIARKEYKRALAILEQALTLDPKSAEVNQALAQTFYTLGNYPNAEKHYREAAKLKPDDPKLRFQTALVLEKLGRTDEMMRELEAASAMPNGDAAIWNYRAAVLYKVGKKDAAVAVLKEAIDRFPLDSTLHYNIAGILMDQERHDEAKLEYEEVLLLDPDNRAAGSYLDDKKPFVSVTAFLPGDIFAHIREGLADNRGLEEIRASLKTSSGQELKSVSEQLLWSGRPLDAISLIEGSPKGVQDQAKMQLILGEAYLTVMRFDNAIDSFRNVLKADPYRIGAQRLLDTALKKKAEWLRMEDMQRKKPFPGK